MIDDENAILRPIVKRPNHAGYRLNNNISGLLADITKGAAFEALGNIFASSGDDAGKRLGREFRREANRNWDRSAKRVKDGIKHLVDGANRSPKKLDDRTNAGNRRKTRKGTDKGTIELRENVVDGKTVWE